MSKKKSQRLKVVLDLAEREERKATEVVESFQKKLANEKIRLSELKVYYQEYASHFQEKKSGIRASDLEHQRSFLTELSLMQKKQEKQIVLVQQGLNKKMDVWRECHLKLKSLKDLIGRLQKQEGAELDRQDQKLLDEWSAQVSRRR